MTTPIATKLGYLAWHADAERRYKAGQRQWQCAACKYWFWPDQEHGCEVPEPAKKPSRIYYRERLRNPVGWAGDCHFTVWELTGDEPATQVKRLIADCPSIKEAELVVVALNSTKML